VIVLYVSCGKLIDGIDDRRYAERHRMMRGYCCKRFFTLVLVERDKAMSLSQLRRHSPFVPYAQWPGVCLKACCSNNMLGAAVIVDRLVLDRIVDRPTQCTGKAVNFDSA
jgi:hypothetical protein